MALGDLKSLQFLLFAPSYSPVHSKHLLDPQEQEHQDPRVLVVMTKQLLECPLCV